MCEVLQSPSSGPHPEHLPKPRLLIFSMMSDGTYGGAGRGYTPGKARPGPLENSPALLEAVGVWSSGGLAEWGMCREKSTEGKMGPPTGYTFKSLVKYLRFLHKQRESVKSFVQADRT